jgi:hypothetical protein
MAQLPKTLEMDAVKLLQSMTIRVKITTAFWLRSWVARQLLRLAAFVLGADIEFDDE